MRRAMARTRDWNCLRHITWSINREYQAIWKLPHPGEAKRVSGLKKFPAFTNGAAVAPAAAAAVPASTSSVTGRGYAKGAYHREQNDGAEEVVGAGNATNAGKSDDVGEEMRVDSFIKVDYVQETDGEGLVEKAKKGVNKVGEAMKNVTAGADNVDDEKEGKRSTTQQMMEEGGDVVDAAADTAKDAREL